MTCCRASRIPADGTVTGSFQARAGPRWKTFANRARLPEPAVLKRVLEVLERVNAHWWNLPKRAVIPQKVLERIDDHMRVMIPVFGTGAD